MIITSFQVTVVREDDGRRLRGYRNIPHRQFKLNELEKGNTEIIEMDTEANRDLVMAIRNHIRITLEKDGSKIFRTHCEPDRLIVRRVY